MNDTTNNNDCLIELGMEELPPKAMLPLMQALRDGLHAALENQRLSFEGVEAYAAPRRLAVIIRALAAQQPDEQRVMRGPPVKVAFDAEGQPTKAAEAFAKKAGVSIDALDREVTDKGEWLQATAFEAGKPAADVLSDVLPGVLDQLPIPRRMRWGDSDASFVRPLHWLVALHGDAVLPLTLFGVEADRLTLGHRFHSDGAVTINSPADYLPSLEAAYVVADVTVRRSKLWTAVQQAAASIDCEVQEDGDLIDETTALCDWPVAVIGEFDPRFLALPPEVLVSTLKVHQRYFPTYNSDGELQPYFITVANIDSRDPAAVKQGNERVVAPRLGDAEFFWRNDRKTTLASRIESLGQIVYQRQLGTLAAKVERISALAATLTEALGADSTDVGRAVALMRTDLVTDMVGEFPDLQGTMGAYYAAADGEPDTVVQAIREQYLPRFAGDRLPESKTGMVVAIADRADTLAGIFAIGKRPTGNRDPFGLRRAALGLLRILIEHRLEIDLPALLDRAVQQQPIDVSEHPELAEDLYDFVLERLRNYYQSVTTGETPGLFDAVSARQPRSMADFDARLKAVVSFVQQQAAQTLAGANKRIANILRNGGIDATATLEHDALSEPAEIALGSALNAAQQKLEPLLAERQYEQALHALCELGAPVAMFFDDVMVMADDIATRRNRMALLAEVRALFLEIADISELQFSH
ncbi:MAG: glycine--tRNA ligase subunit beta [Pseudomonadota bacterium]